MRESTFQAPHGDPAAEVNLPTQRVPALDGIRAIAVAGVLAVHLDLAPGGFLGVDLFFVLSGFLIGTLLLSERDRTGAVDLRGFYARRAGRLLPVAVAAIVVTAAVAIVFRTESTTTTVISSVAALLYVSNLLSLGLNQFYGLVNFTWSLSQEEQFYLIAPWMLGRMPPARRRLWAVRLLLIAALIAAVRVVVIGLVPSWWVSTYNNPVLHADSMIVGVALALAGMTGALPRLSRRAVVALGWLALAGVIAAFALVPDSAWGVAIGIPIATALTALLVLMIATAPTTTPVRLLGASVLIWVGRRSYAIYLWQRAAIVVGHHIMSSAGVVGRLRLVVFTVVVTVIVSALSTRYLETPIRHWVRRRFPDRGRADLPAAPARAELGPHGPAVP